MTNIILQIQQNTFERNCIFFTYLTQCILSYHGFCFSQYSFDFQIKKETLLANDELQQFRNHSSQMAALDFIVSVASNTFVPTYYGNMAKLVEGHRRCAWTLLLLAILIYIRRPRQVNHHLGP